MDSKVRQPVVERVPASAAIHALEDQASLSASINDVRVSRVNYQLKYIGIRQATIEELPVSAAIGALAHREAKSGIGKAGIEDVRIAGGNGEVVGHVQVEFT